MLWPMAVPVSPQSPAGNVYDKYESGNPLVRTLLAGFFSTLDELVDRAGPTSLLDVGCGEGIVTERLAGRIGDGAVAGVDREAEGLVEHWNARPSITFQVGDACALPFADDAFDMVSLIEMLQLVPDHRQALREASRVAQRWVLVTTPCEPLWRAMNLARGSYVGEGGNTPGHVHHFSFRGIQDELAPHGQIVAARRALPWSLVLLNVS